MGKFKMAQYIFLILQSTYAQVDGSASLDAILEDLTCPMEHSMQAQDPNGGGDENDLYSYRRGDIPIFNFDEADRVLIATLQELIEALRKLKSEV